MDEFEETTILNDEMTLSRAEAADFEDKINKTKNKRRVKLFSVIFFLTFISLLLVYFLHNLFFSKYEVLFRDKKINTSPFIINSSNKIFDITIKNFNQTDDYSSKSVLVYDLNSNRALFSKNSNTKTLIASLTKLVSSNVVLEAVNLKDEGIIDPESVKLEGSALELKEGEKFSKEDLLKAAIIASSNQSINAINNSQDTVQRMNKLAESLELKNTKFTNPSGFDDEGNNYSSAEDLIPLAKLFFEKDLLKKYSSMKSDKIFELNSKKEIKVSNTNDLITLGTPGVIAGKTGTTVKAGQNLLLLVQKNERQYLVVLLNGADRYKDAFKVLDRL